MRRPTAFSCFTCVALCAALSGAPQAFPSAEELPAHAGLPDLFVGADGKRLTDRAQWAAQREYLKALMAHYQYGRMPPKPADSSLSGRNRELLLAGAAVRESFRLNLARAGRSLSIRVGVLRPNRPGKYPVIIKNDRWVFDLSEIGEPETAGIYARGRRDEVDAQVFREAIRRGYAICKFNRDDVAADRPDNRRAGVFLLYPEPEYDWGTIAAWAWAYQVIVDALLREDWVDAGKIAATGHSRGGKTALCAAIYDERIAICIPSASGSGGTGSWRYFEPEGDKQDVAHFFRRQPHWFGPGLRQFSGREERLPVDGHTAKALIAPRPLLNTHGRDDGLANPRGTQATFQAAQVVYEWLGKPGNQGLHWRPGGHGQLLEDWLALFDFCDRHFFQKPARRPFAVLPHPAQELFFSWSAP